MLRFKQYILTEAAKDGQYNDEHAHARMWNYAVKHKVKTAKELHKHLDAAKDDPNHELHHSNHKEGWSGGGATRNTDHHQQEHRKASNTVGQLLKNKDFQKSHAAGHQATVAGKDHGKLSKTYTDHGVKQGSASSTSKTDIHIGDHRVSLKQHTNNKPHVSSASKAPSVANHGVRQGKGRAKKKGGDVTRPGAYTIRGHGHLLGSSEPNETKALHHTAITNYLNNHPDHKTKTAKEKKGLHKKLMNHVHKGAAALQAAGGHPYDHSKGEKHPKTGKVLRDPGGEATAKKHINTAKGHFKKVHDAHPGLADHLAKEHSTGKGKFAEGDKAVPTHIVKVGQHTGVQE